MGSRGCLLELGSATHNKFGEGDYEVGLWEPQDMWAGVREGCSWSSVAVLARRLGMGSGGIEREEKVSRQHTWFSGRYGRWLSRWCFLESGDGIEARLGRGGRLGGDGLWKTQEIDVGEG